MQLVNVLEKLFLARSSVRALSYSAKEADNFPEHHLYPTVPWVASLAAPDPTWQNLLPALSDQHLAHQAQVCCLHDYMKIMILTS